MKRILKNYKVATAFNVPITTNVLTILYIGLISFTIPDMSFVMAFLCLMIAYYGIVLGHEFAHVLAAKYYGYETQEVCINLLGGVAIIQDGESMTHKESFMVSVAGPMFNFVLIPLLLLVGNELLIALNFLMMVFNLVPFYPLDGGRMARATVGFFVKNPVKLQYITFYVSLVCFCAFIFISFYFRTVALALVSLLLLAYNYVQLQRVKHEQKLDN